MSTSVRHISDFLHQWAPTSTQMDFDNVGLLIGDSEQEVENILTCLDVTEEVADEAVRRKADLIVAHHPLIFKKLSSVTPDDEHGRTIYKLIRNNIAVIVSHTNLDAAEGGVSKVLAEQIGLTNIEFLDTSYKTRRKIIFYVSDSRKQEVFDILNRHSADNILSHASVEPTPDLVRFEALADVHNVSSIKEDLQKRNMIDGTEMEVQQIENTAHRTGMGAIGEYDGDGLTQEEFLEKLSTALDLTALRYSGSAERIKKVAVCGGAGVFLTSKAIGAGAQAFVTGDVKYHDYFTDQQDFILADVGHYESEIPIVRKLEEELAKAFDKIEVASTEVVTNPMNVFIPSSTNRNPSM